MRPRRDWPAHAALATGAVLFALPVWVMFAGSLQDAAVIARGEMSLLPDPGRLGTYARVLAGPPPVARMLAVSAGMALLIAAGKIVASVLSAYAVAFFRFPLRVACFWTIFATLMLPVEVRIVPTFSVMAGLGLINTFTGLTLPLMASATATLLFRQTFLAVPDELFEAARIDGAGPLRFLWHILLPASAPNLAAMFVILFLYGWNQYLWPLLVATDPRLDTIVIGIVKMLGHESLTEWDRVMAVGMLAILPPVALVLLMQRWFVKGLTEADK
jgi:sn-glycerol 3-phosphate transport system permease protein